MASVVATSILTVKPGHDDELVTQWRELADWIVASFPDRARPPSLYRDLDNPSRFLAFEEWDSVESVKLCRGHPEFQRRAGALLGRPAASVEGATVEPVVAPTPSRDPLDNVAGVALAQLPADRLPPSSGPPAPSPGEPWSDPVSPRAVRPTMVSSYGGPRSSPWLVPLPKTLAEARDLGQRARVGVEKPLAVESFLQYVVGVWVLCTADAVNQNTELKDVFGEWGLVIDADGRWAALFETDGELH